MKYISCSLAMLVMLFITTHSVFSQEEVMEIQSKALGKHERPVVKFPHLTHEDLIECSECHHDYDESGENIGGDGGNCSECHTKKAESNPVPLIDAFHLQCKGCHANTAKSEKKKVPQMCGQCHQKKK